MFFGKKSAGMAATIPAVRVSGKNFFFVLFLIHYGKMGTKHPRVQCSTNWEKVKGYFALSCAFVAVTLAKASKRAAVASGVSLGAPM